MQRLPKLRKLKHQDFDGIITTGIVKTNNDKLVELLTAEGQFVKIAKEDIDFQKQSKSPMPEDLVKHLSLDDVRDLVEFPTGIQ